MPFGVRAIAFPPESRLSGRAAKACFRDAWETSLHDPALSPIEIAELGVAATPAYVETLLRLRNRLARPFGIRPVVRLSAVERPARAWAAGDGFGMFIVESLDQTELVLGIDDTHLDVRVSFLVRRDGPMPTYVVSSLVETHNAVGRAYMLPVRFGHPLVVVELMRRACA